MVGGGVACQCAFVLYGAEALIIDVLMPDRAVSGAHWRTGFGKEHVNAVRTLMEEQEGKTWEGTASDLYNRLKEIIGEATGAEQTDEQPRLDIAALRDRDHPPE